MRSAIGLGDLLVAVMRLELVEPAEMADVAKMLGFSVGEVQIGLLASKITTLGPADLQREGESSTASSVGPEISPPTAHPPMEVGAISGPTLGDGTSFLGSVAASHPAPFVPLVPAAQMPSALRNLLRRSIPSEQPDMDLLVERIAEVASIDTIPLMKEKRASAPVVLVIDISDAAAPYIDDNRYFLKELRKVVPRRAVDVMWADSDLICSPRGLIDRLLLVGARTQILIVSTFGGIAGMWEMSEYRQAWRLFASRVRSEELDVTVIVPRRSLTWPFSTRGLRRIAWEDLGTPRSTPHV